MTNKEKYCDLCKIESSIPISSQEWWLDAVCGEDNWDVVLVEKGGQIVASWPYYMKRKYGFNMITMPALTQTMGVWLRYPEGQKYAKKLAFEKEVFTELVEKLPQVDMFIQNFHYSITNWLPFYWLGFEQTTRYTYRIEDLSDHEKIWSNFSDSARRDIRKGEKNIIVRSDLGIDKFLVVNGLTFARQNMVMPYTNEFVKSLDNACMAHNARKIFFAEDAQGRIHAVLYIVWDSNSARGVMGGGDPELRNSGAYSRLMWEAIKFASTVSSSFDFCGSMIESVEHSFRSFGARQIPYFQITKMSRKMRITQHCKELIKAIANR